MDVVFRKPNPAKVPDSRAGSIYQIWSQLHWKEKQLQDEKCGKKKEKIKKEIKEIMEKGRQEFGLSFSKEQCQKFGLPEISSNFFH